ncbi:MAG: Peptidase like family protein, partial [Marmoricola sp.]|nr:Peptidase like family protein [Marmoricola sp.]
MPLPDPRATLRHPRVVVSLLALVLLVVPLGILTHGRVHGHGAIRLSAAPVPSQYAVTTSGSIRFTAAKGTRTYAGHSYEYGVWTSAWSTPAHPFTQAIPSWNAATPTGSLIQVLVRVRDTSGHVSGLKSLGSWASTDGVVARSSAGAQSDAVARVATDTLVATGAALSSYRITVRLLHQPGRQAPTLRSIGIVTSTPSATLPATSVPWRRTAVELTVPHYSQMTHRGENVAYGGGGEAWCSPTSLAMVLGYYGRLPARSSYRWVAASYPDRWVNAVARSTYDHAYEGTGNWPFNTAYAGTRVPDAFVTRLASLRMAERFIRARIPLELSIRFARGQLDGAPISATAGHLVVLVGFTAAGNPVVNDPAAASDASVRRVYDRGQFERAWLRG